jgi:hypothetical protein
LSSRIAALKGIRDCAAGTLEGTMKSLATAVVIASFICGTCTKLSAADLNEKFKQISFGITREAVIALMGAPDAEINTNTLGVPHAKLRWNGPQGRSYVVNLIADRVVVTKMCDAVADC